MIKHSHLLVGPLRAESVLIPNTSLFGRLASSLVKILFTYTITMERHTRKSIRRVLHQLHRVRPSVVPIMIIPKKLNRLKAVAIHKPSELNADLSFRSGGEHGCGIGRVAVLRLVLDRDGIQGKPSVAEALEAFEEIRCI